MQSSVNNEIFDLLMSNIDSSDSKKKAEFRIQFFPKADAKYFM